MASEKERRKINGLQRMWCMSFSISDAVDVRTTGCLHKPGDRKQA
jgi:hypothetical protein